MPKLIPHIPTDDWVALRRALNKLASVKLGPGGSPTFAGLTLSDLTASALIGTNASKLLESVTIGDSLDYTRPTLDTIQDIRTSATPQFTGLYINSIATTSTTLLTLESDINNTNEYNEILFKVVGGQNYGAIRSCIGGTAGDSYMSLFTTTDGGTLVRQVTIQHDGRVGFGTYNPETLLEMVSTAPYVTLYNLTEEDTDGGGESRLIYKREDGNGTETACFQFEASHDGSGANDQLGKGIWSVNTGTGLAEGMRLNSNIRLGIGVGTGLDPRGGLTVLGDVDILHTAIDTDDHAFEIDLNAAGYGDVKAIDIVYVSGTIGAGEDEEAILVNVDESDSGPGDVAALEVLTTDIGSAKIFGLEVGINVIPIEQLSGTFGNMAKAENDGTPTLTQFITSDSGGANNIEIFVANGDTVLIGNTAKFEEIEFILETFSNPSIKPTFEFSTGGTSFSPFTPADGTNGLRNNGVVLWLDSDIPSWATNTGGNYEIRITRTRANLAATPKEDLIQIGTAVEYMWDKDGDVNINNLTTASGIELGHASDTTITRVSAGIIAVEGTTVMLVGDAATAHAMLDGSVHSDSVADSVTRGSLIYGNTTPNWDELVIGTGFLRGDGTDCAWLSYANSLAAMSGQAGAAFSFNDQNITNVGSIAIDSIISDGAAAALTITATAGQAVTVEGVSFDGGVVSGMGTLGCDAITGTSTAVFEGASVTVGKASTTTGTIVLHDSNSANTITLTVPDITAGSLSFTLPPTDGDNLDVLQTNGSGVLTWVAAGGGASTWIALTDTDPANYTGQAGNTVVVNAGEDGLEFGAAPGGAFTSKCSVYRAANQVIGNATWTKILLDTEDYDTDGEFDIVTNHRFEPDTTGYYHIDAGVYLDSLGVQKLMVIAIYKNGTTWKKTLIVQAAAGVQIIPLSCDMYLLDTDYIELWIYHAHGSNLNTGNAERITFMDVHRFA